MAVVSQNTNNTNIKSILLAEKLIDSNFTNWYHTIRIILKYEKKMMFVEQPIGPVPDPKTTGPTLLASTIIKAFHDCKQEDGHSVSSYLLKMKSYLDTLEHLGYAMSNELGLGLILNSLNKDYDKGKIQKDKKKPRGAKGKDKGKNKLAYAPKVKISSLPTRGNPIKDYIYHHCKEVGHWRRNCSFYHAELKTRKNASGIRESKKLKHGALSLYMGNGMRAAVEAIRTFDLILPSGLIIILDSCHFTPPVTRGVVSISRLVNNGYIHTFTNYGISVSKDNVFYFNAVPRDGIYEIDMHNLYPNVSSIYNVSNKRAKHALDSCYIWHCRLGHINTKRIDMLQVDGLL
nr:hypothetical protein [Tanacetum cinerariifolium]